MRYLSGGGQDDTVGRRYRRAEIKRGEAQAIQVNGIPPASTIFSETDQNIITASTICSEADRNLVTASTIYHVAKHDKYIYNLQ